MTNIKKLSRKVLRKNLITEIRNASSYKEAESIKEEIQQKEFSLDRKIYMELLMRCNDFPTALGLKKEMEAHHFSISEEIYIMLIKKENRFSIRLALLEEMEVKGVLPTIKTYYSLIKNEENLHKVLFIFERMKRKNVEPDDRLYELLHKKFLGSREYPIIKDEIRNYESNKLFILQYLSCENFEEGIRLLQEEGRIFDPITIGKLLNCMEDFSDRLKLLTRSVEEGLEIDHMLYWNFLRKAAQEGLAGSNKKVLKMFGDSLSTTETKKLHDMFTAHFNKIGGKGKYQLQVSFEEEEIMKKAMCASDESSFFYLLGKAAGLAFYQPEIEEELKYIEELTTEEDTELFEYELIRSQGVLEGRKLNEKIYDSLLTQEIPILIIVYLEDTNALVDLYNYSITRGLYPYEFNEINRLNLSGCFFTNSLEQLEAVVEKIDFNHFDVIINIFFTEGDVQFFENHPGSEDWLQTNYPKTQALMPRFLTLKEGYSKNIKSLFSSLYTLVSFTKENQK